MREILFRAKRKDNGQWIEGGYAEHDGKVFIVTWVRYIPDTRDWDTADYYENNPHYNSTLIEIIPETVCQYTGILDNFGKKIFENDIVRDLGIYLAHKSYAERGLTGEENYEKYRESAKIGTVLFCTENVGSCGCCFPRFEGSGFKADDIALEECEVIGNIFDNPELIQN